MIFSFKLRNNQLCFRVNTEGVLFIYFKKFSNQV
jgi:hypothetical protein